MIDLLRSAMATPPDSPEPLEKSLAEAVDELDVPASKYEDAERAYGAVGDWLNRDDSAIARYRPEIYPQGSFALGTAIRPLGEGEYDVDAVCLLALTETSVSQQDLKKMIGDRLRAHGMYSKMLAPPEGGRRCWTLRYADESRFHLDVLPAIPADPSLVSALGVPPEWAEHALSITDQMTWGQSGPWPMSNPKGYAQWFRGRTLEAARGPVRIQASVEPMTQVRAGTALQKAVQLLKRHRDVLYGDDEDKPISIIITTLAARAYEGQQRVADTLRAFVPAMRSDVEMRAGVAWVPNPVNPAENFADKWTEAPRKRELFVNWLRDVERDLTTLVNRPQPKQILEYVKKAYDVRLTAAGQPGPQMIAKAPTSAATVRPVRSSRFDVPHRESPPWPMACRFKVDLRAQYEQSGRRVGFRSGDGPLPKRCWLNFVAATDVPEPFTVHWQVVNTGAEAEAGRGLRGKIFASAGPAGAGLRQTESTLYKGIHWIECFVVRDGACLARSGEFVVSVG